MGYNVLSGSTSVINATVSGSFIGDGSQLENVKQFELQNDSDNRVPFYKTIGSELGLGASSGFTFNSNTNTLTVPALSASAGLNISGVASGTIAGNGSFLGVDANGNIVLTVVNVGGGGGNGGGGGGGGGGSGGINYSRTFITGNYTSSASDTIIGISASANLSITLAAAASYVDGQYFVIKDEVGNADLHNITIKTSGSQTIDGSNSIILESPFAAVNIYTDGVSKFFIY